MPDSVVPEHEAPDWVCVGERVSENRVIFRGVTHPERQAALYDLHFTDPWGPTPLLEVRLLD